MMKFRPFRAACTIALPLLLASIAAPGQLLSQATPFVDPDEPVYHVVDRLVWEGLVDTVLVGQKPYSRLAIARIVAEAERNRGRLEQRIANAPEGSGARRGLERRLRRVDELIVIARTEYAAELQALAGDRGRSWGTSARLERVSAEGNYLDSEPRSIPETGIGGIDARVDPLMSYSQGRVLDRNGGFHAAMLATAQAGRFAWLSAQGAVQGPGDADDNARVDVLALGTKLGNVSLELGRDYAEWGQGMQGGLAISRNAPALDMLRVGSDLPFRWPWILRHLGPTRATLFIADLSAEREFPHAKLVGYQVSILPHPRLELGVTVLDETGGRGAPKATFGERVQDVLPLIDVLFKGNTDFLFSNKLSGAELRFRVPELRGLELHAEGLLDDFDARRIASSLWEDNGIIAGLVLPRLSADGAFRFSAEYHHTGLRYYQHGQFVSGMTLDRTLLGDPLGPNGNGAIASLGFEPTVRTSIELRGAFDSRSGDRYRFLETGPNDEGFGFEKTVDLPEEIRRRLTLTVAHGGVLRGPRIVLEVGAERVSHFGFAASDSRTNLLLRIGGELRP